MSKKLNSTGSLNERPAAGGSFKGAGSHIKHSIEELLPILLNTAAKISDVEQGREHLVNLTGSAFFSKFSGVIEDNAERLALLQSEYDTNKANLKSARETESITPEWLPASRVNHGRNIKDHEETKYRDWQLRHKAEAPLLLILLSIALAASTMTAHANLVGTGLEVFRQNPVLPWTMAGLAPMAGLAIKTMWSHLRHERTRALFTAVLNSVAAIFIIIWVLLFGDQFHGLSASIVSGGLFDEPSSWDQLKETAFVSVTLVTEILIGAVLAHRLDKILSNYAPNYWLRNPESESLQQRIKALTSEIQAQAESIAQLKGTLAEYQKSLDLQLDLARLAYDARRSQADTPTL